MGGGEGRRRRCLLHVAAAGSTVTGTADATAVRVVARRDAAVRLAHHAQLVQVGDDRRRAKVGRVVVVGVRR